MLHDLPRLPTMGDHAALQRKRERGGEIEREKAQGGKE
jgi:hypothetical protein